MRLQRRAPSQPSRVAPDIGTMVMQGTGVGANIRRGIEKTNRKLMRRAGRGNSGGYPARYEAPPGLNPLADEDSVKFVEPTPDKKSELLERWYQFKKQWAQERIVILQAAAGPKTLEEVMSAEGITTASAEMRAEYDMLKAEAGDDGKIQKYKREIRQRRADIKAAERVLAQIEMGKGDQQVMVAYITRFHEWLKGRPVKVDADKMEALGMKRQWQPILDDDAVAYLDSFPKVRMEFYMALVLLKMRGPGTTLKEQEVYFKYIVMGDDLDTVAKTGIWHYLEFGRNEFPKDIMTALDAVPLKQHQAKNIHRDPGDVPPVARQGAGPIDYSGDNGQRRKLVELDNTGQTVHPQAIPDLDEDRPSIFAGTRTAEQEQELFAMSRQQARHNIEAQEALERWERQHSAAFSDDGRSKAVKAAIMESSNALEQSAIDIIEELSFGVAGGVSIDNEGLQENVRARIHNRLQQYTDRIAFWSGRSKEAIRAEIVNKSQGRPAAQFIKTAEQTMGVPVSTPPEVVRAVRAIEAPKKEEPKKTKEVPRRDTAAALAAEKRNAPPPSTGKPKPAPTTRRPAASAKPKPAPSKPAPVARTGKVAVTKLDRANFDSRTKESNEVLTSLLPAGEENNKKPARSKGKEKATEEEKESTVTIVNGRVVQKKGRGKKAEPLVGTSGSSTSNVTEEQAPVLITKATGRAKKAATTEKKTVTKPEAMETEATTPPPTQEQQQQQPPATAPKGSGRAKKAAVTKPEAMEAEATPPPTQEQAQQQEEAPAPPPPIVEEQNVAPPQQEAPKSALKGRRGSKGRTKNVAFADAKPAPVVPTGMDVGYESYVPDDLDELLPTTTEVPPAATTTTATPPPVVPPATTTAADDDDDIQRDIEARLERALAATKAEAAASREKEAKAVAVAEQTQRALAETQAKMSSMEAETQAKIETMSEKFIREITEFEKRSLAATQEAWRRFAGRDAPSQPQQPTSQGPSVVINTGGQQPVQPQQTRQEAPAAGREKPKRNPASAAERGPSKEERAAEGLGTKRSYDDAQVQSARKAQDAISNREKKELKEEKDRTKVKVKKKKGNNKATMDTTAK